MYSALIIKSIFPKGTPVVTLNASDPDLGLNGEVKYSLEPSDSSKDFKLNSQTGLLSVASELDREIKEFYDLTIKAEDSAGKCKSHAYCVY